MKLALSFLALVASLGTPQDAPDPAGSSGMTPAFSNWAPQGAFQSVPTAESAAPQGSTAIGPPLAAQGPSESKPVKPADVETPCEEACWNSYSKKFDSCHARSWVCDFSILGICLSKHQDPVLLADCQSAAKAVFDACMQACNPAP